MTAIQSTSRALAVPAGAPATVGQAGRELGFGPMASMTGVHVIEGKPSIGAHMMAAMIRNSGRYDYEITESTRERCAIKFTRLVGKKWEEQTPAITVTLQEFVDSGAALAKDGKTLRDNWRRCPDDMLFARAISKGYRRHCPDLSCGVSVYVDGEIANDEPAAPAISVSVVESAPAANGTPAAAPAEGPSVTFQEALAGQQPVDAATLDRLNDKMAELKLDPARAFARAKAAYGGGREAWEWTDLTAAQAVDLGAKLDGLVAKGRPAAAVTVNA
jgi:hypothetical protein